METNMHSSKTIISDQVDHWLSERHKYDKTYVGLIFKEIDFSRESPALPQEIAEIINMACFLTRYEIDIELIFDQYDTDYYKLEPILLFLYSIQARVINENYLLDFSISIPQIIGCGSLLTRNTYDAVFEHQYFSLNGMKNIPGNLPIYVLNPFQAIPPMKFSFETEHKIPLPFKSLEESIFGGTFDHLHGGHKILITAAILLTKGKITIGIAAGPSLLENKKHKELLESVVTRKNNIIKFIRKIDPTKELNIVEITDPYGPTINPEVNSTLIVTKETILGGDAINLIRQNKNLKKLNIVSISVLVTGLQTRLSSAGFRHMISCKIIGSEEIIPKLHKNWLKLMGILGIDHQKNQDFIDTWFDTLKYFYSEPWRYYHTLNHIEALYEGLALTTMDKLNKNLIELCIWFHDIIYIPQKKDNEKKSVEFLKKWYNQASSICKLNLNEEEIKNIEEIILYTHDHIQKNEKIDKSLNAQIFLDMDLAILGAPSHIYKEYAQAIRKEYIHISKLIYREKRAEFLKKFLKEDVLLYRTHDFQKLFQVQAKKNIQDEIESLSREESAQIKVS